MKHIMIISPTVDASVKKYTQQAPRYTSYPTALKFAEVDDTVLIRAATASLADEISLYVHIPFCETLCYYCGCNKIVTRHNEKADRYLDYLEREMLTKKALFKDKKVIAVHLGGGSPSFLNNVQHAFLMHILKKHFHFTDETECSIELDPRNVDTQYLDNLANLGYTRLSFGVQDTNYDVQYAINRVQSTANIANLVFHARTVGFTSINLDLIYGLPCQTLESFQTTLVAAKAMSPDRISLFSYAHLPERFAAQRKIDTDSLPSAELKAKLHALAVDSLTLTGFEMIGMDHFARSGDPLSVAKQQGNLHRNFQGYTTRGDADLVGLGVSSISTVGNAYTQNAKKLSDYYASVDDNQSAPDKGLTLTPDDLIRRDVIMALMCNMKVEKRAIERKFNVNFDGYFAEALEALSPLEQDGMIDTKSEWVRVPTHARIFIRAICARFDAYLNTEHCVNRYSSSI